MIDRITQPKYAVFDFETDTHSDIHKPNHHVEVDILQIDEMGTHNYEDCLINSFGINGYGCEAKFCEWLFTEENRDPTIIAHNGAGYDNTFIFQWCLFKGMTPSSFIREGSRITYMRFEKYNIRFIDSIHFFLQPLRTLSTTYNIDTIKGHFPHLFNRPENQNYLRCIPDESFLGVENMNPEEYEKYFQPWYDQQKHITDWNFKTEFIRYCRADVELLSKTALYFRKIFQHTTKY